MKYEVSNPVSSVCLGLFEAASADEAIEACFRDAGYASKADAEAVIGRESELIAVEVTPAAQ